LAVFFFDSVTVVDVVADIALLLVPVDHNVSDVDVVDADDGVVVDDVDDVNGVDGSDIVDVDDVIDVVDIR